MTAEKDPKRESTVNKRYEPPSQEIREAFDKWILDSDIEIGAFGSWEAEKMLRLLDSLPEHVLRALLYHARNGGLS